MDTVMNDSSTSIKTTPRTPEETVKEFLRAHNENDLDALGAVLAPEFVGVGIFGGQHMVREAFIKGFEGLLQSFPDVQMELTHFVSQGDNVAWEHIETATFKASLMLPGGHMLAPTNRSYRVPFGCFARLNAQGLIAEWRGYGNVLSLCQQVGIDPKVLLG